MECLRHEERSEVRWKCASGRVSVSHHRWSEAESERCGFRSDSALSGCPEGSVSLWFLCSLLRVFMFTANSADTQKPFCPHIYRLWIFLMKLTEDPAREHSLCGLLRCGLINSVWVWSGVSDMSRCFTVTLDFTHSHKFPISKMNESNRKWCHTPAVLFWTVQHLLYWTWW